VGVTGALVALCLASTSAWAQQARPFAGASFTASPWTVRSVDGGSPSTRYTNTTTDSAVIGLAAEFGWFNERDALSVEISLPARRGLTQTYRYPPEQYELESRYRDVTIMGVLRHRVRRKARMRIDVVGGAGVNLQDSLERGADADFFFNLGPFGPEHEVVHKGLAMMGGVDVAIDTARHLSVVTQFRESWLPRGNVYYTRQFASFGLDEVVFRFGVGLRVGF